MVSHVSDGELCALECSAQWYVELGMLLALWLGCSVRTQSAPCLCKPWHEFRTHQLCRVLPIHAALGQGPAADAGRGAAGGGRRE
eukprot:235524-Pelagomonas_calceolata.AAC.2